MAGRQGGRKSETDAFYPMSFTVFCIVLSHSEQMEVFISWGINLYYFWSTFPSLGRNMLDLYRRVRLE